MFRSLLSKNKKTKMSQYQSACIDRAVCISTDTKNKKIKKSKTRRHKISLFMLNTSRYDIGRIEITKNNLQ